MDDKARNYAIAAHGEQKYGDQPYAVHLDAVARIAKAYGDTAQNIAYLHDVIEDTERSHADITAEFNVFIADCVAILSDAPGVTRKDRKTKTYAAMAEVDGDLELALLVKAADRLANMRACVAGNNEALLQTYIAEYPTFKAAAYRAGACDVIWDELNQIVLHNT